MVRPLLYMRIMIPPFLAVHLQINNMFQDGRVLQQVKNKKAIVLQDQLTQVSSCLGYLNIFGALAPP